MKIVVCVKQVPEAEKVEVNPETGTLIREGVASILNPFCEYSLDEAVRLKKERDDRSIEVIVVSMGPPQTRAALLRCLELGADKAYLLTDRKFAGADTKATSYTLKEGIKKYIPDFDLIIAGKQAIDGDTAQVGPELAEDLGIPQVTYATRVDIVKKKIVVIRETGIGYQKVECRLPALVTISKGSNIRRFPSMRDVLEARDKPLILVSNDELGAADERLGLNGSPTQVKKVFAPPQKTGGDLVDGREEVENAVEKLFDYLVKNNFIKKGS
ncbi:MAG: electron transfer flavoprotein subunit beta/FixA family protein [Candidatus Hodarchaeota archaeon]